MHPENILLISSTLGFCKVFKFISSKEEQPLNIELISITNWVLKFDISILVNDEQLQNIWVILITILVTKLFKFISVKDLQSAKRFAKFVIWKVSKLDISIVVIEEHPENIEYICLKEGV